MLPFTIDKVLEYESDHDATAGIDRMKKLGYVCVSYQVVAISSNERNTREIVSRHCLGFHLLGGTSAAAQPCVPNVPKPKVTQTLHDLVFPPAATAA